MEIQFTVTIQAADSLEQSEILKTGENLADMVEYGIENFGLIDSETNYTKSVKIEHPTFVQPLTVLTYTGEDLED